MHKKKLLILFSIILTGCASGFETNYVPVYDTSNNYSTGGLERCPVPVVKEFSPNISKDEIKRIAREKGYVLTGQAHWKSTYDEGDDAAFEQGQKVGACFVGWRKADAGVVHTTRTVSDYTPSHESKIVKYDKHGKKEVTKIVVPAKTEYREVPVTYQQYDYVGLFFAKARQNPSSLGVVTDEPPLSYMAKHDSRSGALVASVLNNSHAYNANIFPGDIITKVNGTTVFYNESIKLIPQKDNIITIDRNGKIYEKKIFVQ